MSYRGHANHHIECLCTYTEEDPPALGTLNDLLLFDGDFDHLHHLHLLHYRHHLHHGIPVFVHFDSGRRRSSREPSCRSASNDQVQPATRWRPVGEQEAPRGRHP